LFFLMLLPFFISAQTVFFEPQNINVNPGAQFSLPLKINNVNNLFGAVFDLNFDSNLLEYVGTQEGYFLNQGCNTVLMTNSNTAGKLIFGLTRLGAACEGVSGSGLIATIKFNSKSQNGAAALTFSNNSLCILNGSSCNYITGVWNSATVTIGNPAQCTPPEIDLKANGSNGPINLIYKDHASLSWTSQNAASCAASGDWSGSKLISGSESIELNSVKTYTFILTRNNISGSQTCSDSVQVNVAARPPAVITKPAVVLL